MILAQTYKMKLRYNDFSFTSLRKAASQMRARRQNATNVAATLLPLILIMYKLLYQNHSSRLKTLKCGDFYCRAFLSQESHSFIWLTQSRRIVGRHTDTHILSFSLFRSLSFARVLTLSFSTFITKHLNSMRCWADLIVPFSTSFATFRAFVCAVL